MGFLSSIVAGATVKPSVEAVGDVLNKLFTSDDEKLGRAEAMERLLQRPAEAQIEVNKIEAAGTNLLASTWRPGAGWLCVILLGLYYIPQILIADYLWLRMCLDSNSLQPFPMSPDSIIEILAGMLGFGLFRTAEKFKGVARQ